MPNVVWLGEGGSIELHVHVILNVFCLLLSAYESEFVPLFRYCSGDASSIVAVCVSRRCHERQAEIDLQTPEQLSGPSTADITAEPRQLVG